MMIKRGTKYCHLSELKVNIGETKRLLNYIFPMERLKKYIVREWELKQCLKTIKLVVTILVSAKANETRLNNLILLIAISYTLNSLVKFLEIVMRYI